MKKIAPGLWVPNSERGHKMQSLEGENEIPHIAFLDFLAKMSFWPFGVKLMLMKFEDRSTLIQCNSKSADAISILKSA